jgi:uncharacterized protein YPO0396
MTNFNQFDLIQNRLDRVEAITESNARAIAANSDQTAQTERVLSEAIGRTLAVVERIEERAEEDRVNFQEYRERNDAQMNSLNAAVERLDAILDRLISNQD